VYRIGAQSDRQGYRLDGPTLAPDEPIEVISEGVTFGTIQVPPSGEPIVLMASRQTTGGYPRLGEVASVDLPLLGQLPPGSAVRFQPIDLEEAQSLLLARERDLARTHEAILLQARR
jgi:allophanate hydrolase subunit 2